MEEAGSGIWQASGTSIGPTIMVLGGVHGDEKTGIEIVENLHALVDGKGVELLRGTLTLALGNEEAIRVNRRGTTPDHNLNRMFTEVNLEGPGVDFYESRRARELAPFLAAADISLDIHSTSVPSRPFLPCAFTPRHEKVYRWFDADLVLTDPDFILGGERSTTDEYVDSCGGIGICFETGFAGDTSRLPSVIASITSILADQGMISLQPGSELPLPSYHVYRLTRKIVLSGDGFSYAGHFPESFQEVKKGQVIGYHGKKPEIVAEDGVIAFPKAPGQWHTGHDIFFLARRIR